MNKNIRNIFASLGIAASSSLVCATPINTNDLNQIFSAQGKVEQLSIKEMQETEGEYSILTALVSLSSLNLSSQTWSSFAAGINAGTLQADPSAFLAGQGIDPNFVVPGLTVGSTTESILAALTHLLSLNLLPQTWDSLAVGINDGTFQADPTAFIQGLGIDPNYEIPGTVDTTTSPSR